MFMVEVLLGHVCHLIYKNDYFYGNSSMTVFTPLLPAKLVSERRYTKEMCSVSEDILILIWHIILTQDILNIFIVKCKFLIYN
jgi:hypothetical protein